MVIFRRSVVQNENFFINLIDPKDSQRFIKLKDTLHLQIKQIHSLRKRGKDACKRQKIEQKKRDYIIQFINVTFMQGTGKVNPNQDQFTSNVSNRPKISHSIDRGYIVIGSIGSPVCCSNLDRLEI